MAKILIVDDEKQICEEFSALLQEDDHEVDVAFRGSDAIEKVKQNPYDLIFLDVLMPRMEGREVFEKIKNVRAVPIVVMSGYMPKHKEKEVLSLGALACLRKPLDLARVKNLVNSIAEKQK